MRLDTISRQSWLAATVLAVTATCALPACIGTECTDIGWFEGLTVDLVADGGFADGSYEIVAVADGITLRGRFAVAGEAAACEDECRLVADADDEGFVATLALSGSVASPRLETVTLNVFRRDEGELDGGPDRLALRVRRGGAELTAVTLEPDYRREELAGRGCGVATQAQATVAVPSGVCPATPPSDGERCDAPSALPCAGAEDLLTCSGLYGGARPCRCVDGAWSCQNVFCPPWCPEALGEARAGAACDDRTGDGACYYDEAGDTALCSCSAGTIHCGP